MDATRLLLANSLPCRIWVVGPCGGGKTTVTRLLAARLGVEATHLDDLHWEPHWVERPMEDLVRRVEPIVARDRWVIDGNYKITADLILARAALVLWLDLPLSVTFPRLLKRCVFRAFSKDTICNGNHESLALSFFSKESILLWALTSDRQRRRRYTKRLAGLPHVRLTTQRAIERWLRTALQDCAAPGL